MMDKIVVTAADIENAIFYPVDVPFWMPLPVAPEEKAE